MFVYKLFLLFVIIDIHRYNYNYLKYIYTNSKVTLSITLLRLTSCTDFNDICHGDTLILEERQMQTKNHQLATSTPCTIIYDSPKKYTYEIDPVLIYFLMINVPSTCDKKTVL